MVLVWGALGRARLARGPARRERRRPGGRGRRRPTRRASTRSSSARSATSTARPSTTGASRPRGTAPEWKDWFDGAKAFGKAIWDVLGEKVSPRIVFEHPGQDTIPTSIFVADRGGMVVICAGTSGYDTMVDVRYLWYMQKRYQGSHLFNDEQAAAFNELVRRREDPDDARRDLPVRRDRRRPPADGRGHAPRGQRQRPRERPERGLDRPAVAAQRSWTSSTSTPPIERRVDERDQRAARSRAGAPRRSGGPRRRGARRARPAMSSHAVRDVVQARTVRGQEPADRASRGRARRGAARTTSPPGRGPPRRPGRRPVRDATARHRARAGSGPPTASRSAHGDAHVVDVGEPDHDGPPSGSRVASAR